MTGETSLLESRFLQALIAGLVVAIGWLANGWWNRRERRAMRAEKLRDHHRALFAEIASYLENLSSVEELTMYRDRMEEIFRTDPDYVPLIPREKNDTIFRALVEEINILPRVTIDPIVHYYAQVFAIETMIEDMRGERFKTLGAERRALMYSDYIDLKIQAFHDGHFALRMIAAYAKGGREAALAEEKKISRELSADISNPDADPSGRSQG